LRIYVNRYTKATTTSSSVDTIVRLSGTLLASFNSTTNLLDTIYTTFSHALQEDEERQKVITDPNYIMPAAFVSFKTQWGAAVCAQTQQTSKPTVWLTEWAPEPRDVFWANLAIPFVELSVRRLIVAVAFFFLTFFFMIPIAIVQSLANLEEIEKVLPFLKPIIER